jgi:hypothetical protein
MPADVVFEGTCFAKHNRQVISNLRYTSSTASGYDI